MLLSNSLNNEEYYSKFCSYFVNQSANKLIVYSTENIFNHSCFYNTPVTKLNLHKAIEVVESLHILNYILIFVTNILDLKRILLSLKYLSIWDASSTRFILHFEEDVNLNSAFQVCWDYFIINVIVVKNMGIYSYFPYNSCTKNISSELVASLRDLENYDIFPNKIPLNLRGCVVKIAAVVVIPLVIDTTEPRDNPLKSGIEVTILNIIAQHMNFTEFYLQNNSLYWGYSADEEIYDPLHKMLHTRDIDIMYGYSNIVYNKKNDLAWTVSHITDVNYFWVPASHKLPAWKHLIKIFEKELWISLIVTIIFNSICFWMLAKLKSSKRYNKLSNCFFSTWGVLLDIPTITPERNILRIPFIIWCIACLIICSAYKSKLVCFLTKPLYEHQIDKIKALINSDLAIGIDANSLIYFEANNSNERQLIGKRIPCEDFFKCLNDMVTWRNISVFNNKRTMKYLIGKNYTDSDGHPLIVKVRSWKVVDFLR